MDFLDIGFFEIILILIVALLVVGPDRIPEFARKLGKAIRNFREITSNITGELSKALDVEEETEEMKKTVEGVKETLNAEAQELRQSLDIEAKELKETLDTEAKELAETIESEAREAKKTMGEGIEDLSQAIDKEAKELAEVVKSPGIKAGEKQGAKKIAETKTRVKEPPGWEDAGESG